MPYSSYDHDKLEAAETMRIERRIYFEAKDREIAPYASLPIAQLLSMRSESAAAEQAIFDDLKERAAAWEEQAGRTLLLDKTLEYVRTPHVQHTANEWQTTEHNRHIRSNRVYQMNYYIYENTRYDKEAQKSIPYSWTLTWSVRTNSPSRTQAKIAGQDRKVFTDKAAMEKYLNGRIKAYDRLFTEISPPIPQEYADYFKVNGMLMPDYTIEGEEPPQQQQAAAIPENTGQEKEREHMSEQFSIMIGNRSRFDAGDPGGYWLDMPATKEQLHEAMRNVGITADNPQDFSIRGYSDDPEKHIALPYEMVCAADVDELNFLAARLEQLDPAEVGKLNAALQQKNGLANIGQVIDFTYNVDFYVHIPEVHNYHDLGDYYLNQSGMVQMPEEWKGGIDLSTFGRNAAAQEKGAFTEYGYIVESGDEWERQFEGREVPEEYRIMSYPQPERGEQDKAYMDAAETQQADAQAAEPQQPRPVVPIILTSEKPAEKVKEITARLEQGVQAIFDSDRYKEFLTAMSKFHDYSLNNTILIAMQGGNLVMGFRQWEKEFDRHVKKGEKGIKIFAPAPYKVKKLVDKIDPETRKPMLDREGKVVKEEKEITVPAFKVITVFDISQTEGKEFPDLSVKPLLADVEQYEDFFAALEKASPVPIAFEQITNGANGYFSLTDKRIAIKEGVSELQAVKTAIHEIAHAKLHDIDLNAPKDEQPRVDRRTREVEAESVAYTVCQHYGLDTSDYSFGYVAGWSSGRELSELKSSLETIRSAAAEIINSIDENLAELQKAQDKEQTAGQEQPTREEKAAPKEQPQPEAPAKADTAGKEKPEAAAPGKSGAQEKAGAAPKEAFTPETIYRVRRNPYSDSRENSYLLQAYVTQENGRAKMGDVLYTGTPEKCRELMGQLKGGELTEGDVKQLYAKAQETAQTAGQDKDTFSIYQIKGGDETRDFRFEPYDRLQAAGNVVDRANYELVYSAPLAPETSLEDIYTRFNIDHPKDFKGHSLSVSDVVVLHQDGQDAAHFVDSVGFREVPEFLQEQKQLTPDDLETGETVKTPRGTFHVTAMSREQIEAAGYGFHHQSDDGKYLIMGNGTRAFAVAAEQAQRDNPLKTAEQTTEQNGNMIDGIINNTPTVDELEAKVKAGEQISLVDLANAVKADKERGKGAKPEKKPSIRAQLRADKEKAQKKNAKQKSQDLERS